ncbi:hypothetical protein [Paenibacillus sp. HJGM_3]|uniref:hypothetical protein n=1 Tax=Paenibacillus sp. HJGM_3 TaxID=3379816 RepID=UPI00385EB91D
MKKSRVTLFAILAAALLVVTACSGNKEGAAPTGTAAQTASPQGEMNGPFTKYTQPVTLTTGYYIPDEYKWPEGTINDNEYTKLYEDKLNIKFTHAFEVPHAGYEQKVNLLISSNDIPDVLVVTESQFKLLAESDMLADLTKVYEEFASPTLKKLYGDYGPEFMRKVTYNNKLVGLPSTAPARNNDGVVWIRRDWLKNVGIELPDVITLADLEKVSKAFIENDPDKNGKKDTYGIQSTSNFVTGTMGYNTLDLLFTAHKAYPKIWTKDKNGNITYGSLLPETKQALGTIREWYAKGLIDKEFGTIKPDQFAKDINAAKAGITMGQSWSSIAFPDSVKNDPTADWNAHILVADDGKYYSRQSNPIEKIVVVKKGVKNPEAVLKVINLMAEMDNRKPNSPAVYTNTTGTTWTVRPIQVQIREKFTFSDRIKNLKATADGKFKREDLPQNDIKIFDDYKKGYEALKADPAAWAFVIYLFNGGKVVLSPLTNEVYSEYYGITKSMETKWANLTKLENEAFMRIIVGDKPLDYFETFIDEWKKQGGDEITKEVAAEIKRLSGK